MAGVINAHGRSFSSDADDVIQKSIQVVKGFARYNIGSCYKHFPGHGSASGDSHTDAVDVSTSYHLDELKPYLHLNALDAYPLAVMTGHLINRQLDPEGAPATLSSPMLNDTLRGRCQFDGVIISDDLQMHAIAKQYDLEDAMIKAINAGCDMLIVGNQLDCVSISECIGMLESAYLKGEIAKDNVQKSLERVAHFKQKCGLAITTQSMNGKVSV
jgi:beta-N-acetylhexosaminidase